MTIQEFTAAQSKSANKVDGWLEDVLFSGLSLLQQSGGVLGEGSPPLNCKGYHNMTIQEFTAAQSKSANKSDSTVRTLLYN
jgi:hypothetical protein